MGHPLIDSIENFKNINNKPLDFGNKPVIAILPGSRKQEINKILSTIKEIIDYYPDYEFVIAGAQTLMIIFINQF